MLEFQQSEQIAERRRWILVLVDTIDGVTGKTGQTGSVYISKNGGSAILSTNGIVEVDSTDMPGHYYIELTEGELDTLGHISISYKSADTLAFHDRALVSYNDPFSRSGGAMFVGSGSDGKGGITKSQAGDLLKSIKKIVQEEIAQIKMPQFPEIPAPADYTEMLQMLMAQASREPDYSPILEAIGSIEKPTDYQAMFQDVTNRLEQMSGQITAIDFPAFAEAVSTFRSQMDLASEDINGSIKDVTTIKTGFEQLSELMDKFQGSLAEQSDMDKRFNAMSQAQNNAVIEQLRIKIIDLAIELKKIRHALEDIKQ